MTRRIALLVLTPLLPGAFGRPAITVSSGNPTLTLPEGAPWNHLGAPNQPSRWEMRIFDFGADWPVNGPDMGPVRLWDQDATLVWATSTFRADTLANNGAAIANCCRGRRDVLVRVQRDTAQRRYTFEVCDTAGGNCVSSSTVIQTFGRESWSGQPMALGGPGYRLGFFRWYSTLVPVGTAVRLNSSGDLADWEFQGNLRDSVHGLEFNSGAVAYVEAPRYAPSCDAGPEQIFRAGSGAHLDGSQSQALDGSAGLTYRWRQLPGVSPVEVLWDNARSASPTISGLVFGSYNFELTVTDASGQASTCVVHDGAVATDDQGVVITDNPAVERLLGPAIQLGRNPWPWMDDRNRYTAGIQIANIERYYRDFWDTPAAGKVSVTAGGRNVTGTGTHFQTDVCGKNGNPAVPRDNMALILWWRSGKGRRAVSVQSCADDTHLILADTYRAITITESALSYSLDDRYSLVWQFGGSAQFPANYYDNVAGFYGLYSRSGIDRYLQYARKLADLFWASPMMDQGYAGQLDSGEQWAYPGRAISALGLVLRALDGRPEMWEGLHKIWDTDIYLSPRFQEWGSPGLYDTREQAYQAFRLGLCGLYDPDLAYRAKCKAAIQTQIGTVWRPVHEHWNNYAWPQFYSDMGSAGNTSYVTVAAGSPVVTLHGSNWPAGQFNPRTLAWFFVCGGTPGTAPGCGRPATNRASDADLYRLAYVDSSHARLVDPQGNPRPYAGTSGDKGYVLGNDALGWATQPFMAGIVAAGLDLEAQAMNDAGFDRAAATLLYEYAKGSVDWLGAYGVRASTKGMYGFVGGVNCPEGKIPETASWCMTSATPSNPEADRVLNAEAVRGMMFNWLDYSREAAAAAKIDKLVNAQWAKPGTCPAGSKICVPDGFYMPNYDPGGAWVSGTPPQGSNPKWFGMAFGMNPQASWPAMRLGGARPAKNEQVTARCELNRVTGAVKAKVTITAPDGRTSLTECSTETFTVTVDVRLGAYRLRFEYLSATGAVLGTHDQLLSGR